jgi:L-ascorbate metabolism protein UlaG (beta-lactamase superfamily)
MKITQLRSATLLIEHGAHRILVDPMLAAKDALPPLRFLDGVKQRNPTVELPPGARALLDTVTHVLITHCQRGHFDHLDRAGVRWLREHQVPVICTPHDADYLSKRGLNVHPLSQDHRNPHEFLDGSIRTVGCTHGKGWVRMLMEHGVGYFIEWPGEPSLYLSGDTVLTSQVRNFVAQHQPDVCVVPAGGASLDMGQELIMGIDEVMAFTQASRGWVVANHLEALSHCPVTREQLRQAALQAGISDRLLIPADGETLVFDAASRDVAMGRDHNDVWSATVPGSAMMG